MKALSLTLGMAIVMLAAGCSRGNSNGGSSSNGNTGTPLSPSSNRNPTITNVSVTPTFGVSGLTNVSMSATASDPDGDSLSYQWTFAGSTASGPAANTNLSGDGAVIGSYLDTFLDGQMDSTGRVITGTTRSQSSNSTNTFRMVKE